MKKFLEQFGRIFTRQDTKDLEKPRDGLIDLLERSETCISNIETTLAQLKDGSTNRGSIQHAKNNLRSLVEEALRIQEEISHWLQSGSIQRLQSGFIENQALLECLQRDENELLRLIREAQGIINT